LVALAKWRRAVFGDDFDEALRVVSLGIVKI
jgi:hypothetical protein